MKNGIVICRYIIISRNASDEVVYSKESVVKRISSYDNSDNGKKVPNMKVGFSFAKNKKITSSPVFHKKSVSPTKPKIKVKEDIKLEMPSSPVILMNKTHNSPGINKNEKIVKLINNKK
jgi:hypothetical protein